MTDNPCSQHKEFLRGSILVALTAALTALSSGPAVAASCQGPPTLLTITPDGTFSDWSSVLANPANLTLDGDGSSIPCPNSDDRDCPIPSPALDLLRFAWTYDATALYVFIERSSGSGAAARC